MSAQLETKEAGTGRWVPIIIYVPGTAEQYEEAGETAKVLRAIGLYAVRTGFAAQREQSLGGYVQSFTGPITLPVVEGEPTQETTP